MSNKELLATWPETIWLQCCDEELHEYSVVESEVSWCVDKIHTYDVEYVRKDIADADKLDAERYRRLRHRGNDMSVHVAVLTNGGGYCPKESELDKVMDHALKEIK